MNMTSSVYLLLTFLAALEFNVFAIQDYAKMFDDYYKCINKKNAEFSKVKDEINAVLVQEGQSVELSCKLCIRPDQEIESYDITWTQSLAIVTGERRIFTDDEQFIISPKKNLIIKDLSLEDAGQYACLKNGEYEAVYQVDVVRREKRVQVVESGHGRKPADVTISMDRNLIVFTTWSKWSACNHCNRPGFRRRIGICTVKKIDLNLPIKPKDVPQLKHYTKGVPCRSTVLPSFIKKLPAVKNRPSETLISPCNITCPTLPPVKNITDETGKIVEVVNEAEGYYSMKERPTLPPLIKRKTVYEQMGRRLVMECPKSTVSGPLIRWQNGSSVYNPKTVRKQTRGRVRIDVKNRLHIRRLRKWDSKIFSCWIHGKLVATIRVTVTERMNRNIKDYVTIAGLGLAMLTLICICCSVCCGRKKKTMR